MLQLIKLDSFTSVFKDTAYFYFFKDFDTTAEINDRIRTTYDGPLSLAEDFMVWNVTKDDIRVRMAVVNEEVWPPPATEKAQPPQRVG